MEDLLFLTQRIPFPPTKGDKIRSWHFLRHLAERYRVHLGCFVDDRRDWPHVRVLEELCASLHCEPLNPSAARLRSLRALVRGEPMTLRYFASGRLRRWVDATARQNGIRRAFVFCSAMAPYAVGLPDATRVLDMVDVDSEKWLQYARSAGTLGHIIYTREGTRLLAFERRMAQLYDRTLLVSEAEASLFRRLGPESADKVLAVPNGVDSDFFSPARSYPDPFEPGTHPIVFTGAMDYRPNIEAVQWFVGAVMPQLTRGCKRVEFWIVGANPVPRVQELANRTNIRVTGRVDDVRPYLAHAHAVVAPLRTARGIQNKVLEAMAMAKVVVATPQAHEGIDAIAGEELFVADDAETFVFHLRLVLSGGAATVGQRARQRVEADWTWSKSLKMIDSVIGARDAMPCASKIGESRVCP